MDDARTGRHPADFTGAEGLHLTETVPVNDLPIDQVGHGRKADMGMRSHVETLARIEHRGTHLVEEDKGADHSPMPGGQYAPHLETAHQVHWNRQNDGIYVYDAGIVGWSWLSFSLVHACPPALETRLNGTA